MDNKQVIDKFPVNLEGKQKPIPKSKLPLIALAGVLTLIIASSVYIFSLKQTKQPVKTAPVAATKPSPTPDPTTDWKIYINEKMKFSIKLPSSWFTHPEVKSLSGYNAVFSYPIDNPSSQNWRTKQRASISISMFPNKGKSTEQQIQDRINSPKSDLKKQTQKIKVDVEQGIILHDENGQYEEILINHQDSTYLISLSTPTGIKTQSEYPNVQLEEILPVFNQILSTFKFLDQNQAADTSNWKTYANTKYKYSINYPASWSVKFQGKPQSDPKAKPVLDQNLPYFVRQYPNIGIEAQWVIFPALQDNSMNLELNDWINKTVVTPAQTRYKNTNDKTQIQQTATTINGKQIITVSGAFNPRRNDVITAYIALDDKVFSLMLDPYNNHSDAKPQDKDAQQVLLQMISTAQVTK